MVLEKNYDWNNNNKTMYVVVQDQYVNKVSFHQLYGLKISKFEPGPAKMVTIDSRADHLLLGKGGKYS